MNAAPWVAWYATGSRVETDATVTLAVIGVLTFLVSMLGIFGRHVWQWLRRAGRIIRDLEGTPARPGVPAVPGVMERLAQQGDLLTENTNRLEQGDHRFSSQDEVLGKHTKILDALLYEVRTNGGGSMRDEVAANKLQTAANIEQTAELRAMLADVLGLLGAARPGDAAAGYPSPSQETANT